METLSSLFSPLVIQLALVAILFGFMRLRFPVTPKVSLKINASAQRIYDVIDIVDGKSNDYGNSRVHHTLVDAAQRLYKFTYTTVVAHGRERKFEALFRVAEHHPGQWLRLERAGIDSKSQNNELLVIDQKLVPDGDGTRLNTEYHWGPRPVLAQLLARVDLLGGCHRLKGLIETGIPNERTYQRLSALLAIGSALITFATFYIAMAVFLKSHVMGLLLATGILLALFIHEFGHLLAYRMIGQPWGRMMFLPLLGAIAMPRLSLESQAQTVFAALMGPGFSVLLALLCMAPILILDNHTLALLGLGMGAVTVFLNIFNLMPIEPLDGGIALRSIFAAVIGNKARFGLMACGAVIALVGYFLGQIIVVIFGLIAIIANLRNRKIDIGLVPLTSLQVAIGFFGYITMASAYMTLYKFFVDELTRATTLSL
jgi:Zn-dependent protease